MSKSVSPYYPPRARWYSLLFDFGSRVRRGLALDRVHVPKGISLWGLAATFLIPGLGVYLRGPRLWGKIAMVICGLLFLQFIVWLGHPWGNYAFGLMLSIHTTGIVYYCSPLLVYASFSFRLLFTVGILLAVGGLIYAPLRSTIQERWLMPVRVNGQVVVIQKKVPANAIRRGDWVAYALTGYVISEHGYRNADEHSGLGLGPVLALAGDHVGFSPNAFTVNGISHPLLAHMPTSGTLTVPEKHWFIWPDLAISGHGNVGEASISAAMLQMADVSENQFVGKPFNRWFWRRQSLP
ncbi:MAG TPA: hypothetical protein VMA13_08215 [Candidatus Saccharimonadales bacterium]|nr:hypothetical protein [Candidatus Saccharimonadales bacterium]